MASGFTRPNETVIQHINKGYKFAEGGKVTDDPKMGLSDAEWERNQKNYQQWMNLRNAIRQQKQGK